MWASLNSLSTMRTRLIRLTSACFHRSCTAALPHSHMQPELHSQITSCSPKCSMRVGRTHSCMVQPRLASAQLRMLPSGVRLSLSRRHAALSSFTPSLDTWVTFFQVTSSFGRKPWVQAVATAAEMTRWAWE